MRPCRNSIVTHCTSTLLPGPSVSWEEKMKKDSYWIQDIKQEFEVDGLGDGEDKKLKNKELMFWKDLIAKYLTPLTQTKKEKADAAKGLKELRDSSAFSFLMINR